MNNKSYNTQGELTINNEEYESYNKNIKKWGISNNTVDLDNESINIIKPYDEMSNIDEIINISDDNNEYSWLDSFKNNNIELVEDINPWYKSRLPMSENIVTEEQSNTSKKENFNVSQKLVNSDNQIMYLILLIILIIMIFKVVRKN